MFKYSWPFCGHQVLNIPVLKVSITSLTQTIYSYTARLKAVVFIELHCIMDLYLEKFRTIIVKSSSKCLTAYQFLWNSWFPYCLVDYFFNSLMTEVPIIKKPVNWFTLQISGFTNVTFQSNFKIITRRIKKLFFVKSKVS